MRIAACLAALVVTTSSVLAQRPEAPAFEVASVRLASGPGVTSQRMTDTRVDFALIPLRTVLLMAFRARGYELVGPDWLAETLVAIQATIPPGATRQQVPEMLQRLLAERFGLVVRRESREMDVHELSVASGGHQMREVSAMDELGKTFPVNRIAEQLGTLAAMDRSIDTPDGQVRTVMGEDMGRTTLTARSMYKLTLNAERRTQTLEATRMTMAELATVLTDVTGQPVLDQTNLRGLYQFSNVELALNARILENTRMSALRFGFTPPEMPNVSAAKALETLGLRLERRRAPIDVIVVDKIERTPTDN